MPTRLFNRFGTLPLRLVLVVPFVLQTSLLVGLLGWLSFYTSKQAVTEITSQIRDNTTTHIEQNLRQYLQVPHQVIQNNAIAFEQGQWNLRDLPRLERYFQQQIKIYGGITFTGLALETRENIGAERSEQGTLSLYAAGAATSHELRLYTTLRTGGHGRLIKRVKNFDPRARPWYRAAVRADRPVWSPIYLHIARANAYIAASLPIHGRDGKLKGVVVSNLNLSQIGKFLQNLRIGKTGQSFVIERSGLMVATSTGEAPFQKPNRQGAFRIRAIDSQNLVTRATARYLADRYGKYLPIVPETLELTIAGNRHLVQIQPLKDRKGLDWLIVVVVPEADFTEQITANTRTAVVLCLVAVILAIGVSGWTSRRIATPIWQLADASQRIARDTLSQPVKANGIQELGVLAQSFNQMSQEIQQSRHKLEEHSRSLEYTVKARTRELQREIHERLVVEDALRAANQELQRLAYMDGLTQVANRRYFDERLEYEWRRLLREHHPLSLILCDVDFFKQYNDTYGHQIGDDCLRFIASAIRSVAKRATDLVVRYGGEEFAVILSNTPLEGAVQVAQEIRTAVRQLQLPHQHSSVSPYVTLSLGVACIVPTPGTSAVQLIAAADRSLYQAKAAGRDRIMTATQLQE